MATAKVKVALFRYLAGKSRRHARKDDVIKLSTEEYERGLTVDAFYTPEDEARADAAAAEAAAAETDGEAPPELVEMGAGVPYGEDGTEGTAAADEPTTPPPPDENNDPYDELTVAKAIAFLDTIDPAERASYFAKEQAIKRKGVLTHFDQPIDF